MHRSPRTPFEMQEFRREDSALKAKSFFGGKDRFKVITDILAIAKTGMTSARLPQGSRKSVPLGQRTGAPALVNRICQYPVHQGAARVARDGASTSTRTKARGGSWPKRAWRRNRVHSGRSWHTISARTIGGNGHGERCSDRGDGFLERRRGRVQRLVRHRAHPRAAARARLSLLSALDRRG